MTRLTSLVAVDRTPSRPDGAHLTRAEIPLNLPAGWDFDKVFGGERAPRRCRRNAAPTPIRRARCSSMPTPRRCRARRNRSRRSRSRRLGQNGVTLPKTATDAELRLWLGLLLCLASLILLAIVAAPASVR